MSGFNGRPRAEGVHSTGSRVFDDQAAALGQNVTAKRKGQVVVGRFNADDPDAVFMVGTGKSDSERKSGFKIKRDGAVDSPIINYIVKHFIGNDLGTPTAFRNFDNVTYDDVAAVTKYPAWVERTSLDYAFQGCSSLEEVPAFDMSNVTHANYMFSGCSLLKKVPVLDTSKLEYAKYMFQNCSSLEEVPAFDLRSAKDIIGSTFGISTMTKVLDYMFKGCTSMKNCWVRNIKAELTVGSGTSYGHLLTVESLLSLIYELVDSTTGDTKTLTVGSANLAKLADIYVRRPNFSDEKWAELDAKDDLLYEKIPFELCESTDEGAMSIDDYVAMKNWILA